MSQTINQQIKPMTDKQNIYIALALITIIGIVNLVYVDVMRKTLNRIEKTHEIIQVIPTEDSTFSLHYSGKAYDALDSITLDSMLQVISEDSLHKIEIDKD